jgi:enterochelin esterase family protein
MRWHYEVTDTADRRLMPRLSESFSSLYGPGGAPLEVYTTHPDSVAQAGVPTGRVTAYRAWPSAVFPGTKRDWWVYVPAQYRPEEPACLMVFQDGADYVDYVPTIFDNLIARGDIPVTVGVFVSPGERGGGTRRVRVQIEGIPQPPLETWKPQRNYEYDTCSDAYARFLLGEILTEVTRTVNLRPDPESRAIAGISSGANCAFTVAWERPDAFGRVLSWCGSFTNIGSFIGPAGDLAAGPGEQFITDGLELRRSGRDYPSLIRMTPPKPIKVILQDGENDLDKYTGNWWLANQEMAKALEFAGYDYSVAWGHGFHGDKHGRAILPDSLRELWRD